MVGVRVYLVVALMKKWDLLSVNSGKHFVKRAKFNVNCFDMFDVMHFYLFVRATVGTVLVHCTKCADLPVSLCQRILFEFSATQELVVSSYWGASKV